jgi:hypothetical protein
MDTTELQEFFDDDGLTLPPIKSKAHPEGKEYTVESPDYDTGLLLQQLASIATRLSNGIEVSEDEARRLKFNDDEEQSFAKMVLGDTLAEMLEDGVRWAPIRAAVQYCFTYYGMGAKQAEKLVQSASPKAPAPANRGARRAKKKKR